MQSQGVSQNFFSCDAVFVETRAGRKELLFSKYAF